MVNPKLLIFSSHHVVFKEARLINNISTRNAVCVISGRHLNLYVLTDIVTSWGSKEFPNINLFIMIMDENFSHKIFNSVG